MYTHLLRSFFVLASVLSVPAAICGMMSPKKYSPPLILQDIHKNTYTVDRSIADYSPFLQAALKKLPHSSSPILLDMVKPAALTRFIARSELLQCAPAEDHYYTLLTDWATLSYEALIDDAALAEQLKMPQLLALVATALTHKIIRSTSCITTIRRYIASLPGARLNEQVCAIYRNYLTSATPWEIQTSLPAHITPIVAAAFSPDGTTLATAFNTHVSLWDTGTYKLKAMYPHHGVPAITHVTFSADSAQLITRVTNNTIYVWNTITNQLENIIFSEDQTVQPHRTWSSSKEYVLTIKPHHTAQLLHTKTQKRIMLTGHIKPLIAALFSPSDTLVVTTSCDHTARLWDTKTGKVRAVLKGHTAPVAAAAFCPAEKYILTISYDNTVKIWDTRTGVQLHTIEGQHKRFCTAAFSPDGRTLITTYADGTAHIWHQPAVEKFILPPQKSSLSFSSCCIQ